MYDYFDFDDFRNVLQYTLLSDINGFTVHALRNEWEQNEPISLDVCAKSFGFPNCELLLQDESLQDILTIERAERNGSGLLIYKGVLRPEISHIYKHMLSSNENSKLKELEKEKHKLVRATLPQYQAKCIEGKKLILRIAAELGAETHAVQYQKIQERYLELYDRSLNSDELRRYFAKSSASKVFLSFCFDEVELSIDETNTGNMFVKLKMPYKKLIRMWKEKLHVQCEASENISKLEEDFG